MGSLSKIKYLIKKKEGKKVQILMEEFEKDYTRILEKLWSVGEWYWTNDGHLGGSSALGKLATQSYWSISVKDIEDLEKELDSIKGELKSIQRNLKKID